MIIYVVTIYNTFANGTRYVEVNRSAFRTKAKDLAEELVVELLLIPSSDRDGLAAMADKIVDSDLSDVEVENLHLVVGRIRREVGIDLSYDELPRMFMCYHNPIITTEIFWKDLTPEKRLEIGLAIVNANMPAGELLKLSDEQEKEFLKDDWGKWDMFPMAQIDLEIETPDL